MEERRLILSETRKEKEKKNQEIEGTNKKGNKGEK